MKHTHIPGWLAIVININILLASAFCIDLKKIWASSGGMPIFFIWLLGAVAFLPIILVLARLAWRFPFSGGLYVYNKRALGEFWGFVSGWGYFVGTIAANGYIIHLLSAHIHRIPAINSILERAGISDIWIEIGVVVLFALLNLVSIYIVFALNLLFILFKLAILIVTVMVIPKLFNVHQWSILHLDWQGFVIFVPFVLFSYTGIESCCSVADKITESRCEVGRVIMISFAIITTFYLLFQFVFFCLHGANTFDPFFHLMPLLTDNQQFIAIGDTCMTWAVITSFLAGYYGMFYYNSWNLHAIAMDKEIEGIKLLRALNRYDVPWLCVCVQALLIIPFIVFAHSNFCLMTLGVAATIGVYFLSTLSFLIFDRSLLGYIALVSCAGMLSLCMIDLWRPSARIPLCLFVGIVVAGIVASSFSKFWSKS
ncbi:MAG: APC family permease [Candidatus Babeliales bacterium]|jgi:amino acid transporter